MHKYTHLTTNFLHFFEHVVFFSDVARITPIDMKYLDTQKHKQELNLLNN